MTVVDVTMIRIPRLLRRLASACALAAVVAFLVLSDARPVSAFWVVNFGTSRTLSPGTLGFAAGMGGQMVFVGEPKTTNGNFLIPHAGFRLGLLERVDAGWRLAPVPLPFSTVGPGFGANIDVKVRLTSQASKLEAAVVGGAGLAHVLVLDDNRIGWSPNGAGLLTCQLGESTFLTFMGRYVYLALPTAAGGASDNFVHIVGASAGLKLDVAPKIALLPEVGAYWYEGRMADRRTSGPGFQYGIMLATTL